GRGAGATWALIVGTLGTLITMGILEIQAENRFDGVFANEPIYVGLILSAIVYIVVSLATKPTDPEVLAAWIKRTKEGAPSLEQVEEDARGIEEKIAKEA
ncbi:MAG: sodium:solute symporter, partial [Corynebacterium casei]|nr:sodium:solute symporter [Corynebacterium casei]